MITEFSSKTLDVGCGRSKRAGSIGIDRCALEGVDIVHDLEVFPYPIQSDWFEEIYLTNVIEHISNIVGLMEELHRVSADGAEIFISTPHFSSLYSYEDPTHVRHMSYDSMDYFSIGTRHANFYTEKKFQVINKRIDFGRSIPLSWIAKGISMISRRFYEKHFCFVFPANQLFFQLKVIK